MENKLNNPNTSQNSYYKIFMNKCKSLKIPPLLVNKLFILNCREKTKLFADFSQQCKPIYLTNEKIECIHIENEDVISLVYKLNPNMANASVMQ